MTQTALKRAMTLEAQQDLPGALAAYEAALREAPDSLDIARRLAGLAFRLGHFDMAERFYAHLITHGLHELPVICAYAASLREQGRFDEAIALLKPLIGQHPDVPQLWAALGDVLSVRLDYDNALIFYNEALRLAPDDAAARLNRGGVLMALDQHALALSDLKYAADTFEDPDSSSSAGIAYAQALLAHGHLAEGWQTYTARYRYGTAQEVHYAVWSPHWRPGKPLAGCKLLVSAEQGLGDEVLFASILPDLLRDLGPFGRLTLAVEPRLVSLFQRSFPAVHIVAHHTQKIDGRLQRTFPGLDQSAIEAWALLADFLPLYRSRIDSFPSGNAFLTPDPARIAHWRNVLDSLGDGPKIGILWKSLKSGLQRDPNFAPFTDWRDVLTTPNAHFINLQYGDTAEEQACAETWGAALIRLPDLDLKDDLDELAALSLALDLIIAPANATSNIAAACGAPVWLIMPPRSWPQLGQPHYPWYPTVRTFSPSKLPDWQPAMQAIQEALTARFNAPYKG
ncbi:tetratricopeptide repeat protein [Asticcacaulis sp. EMRT-3]|uniref:tetratricopeptide repeat protein n=1 Tax=Asticcacaulis sp. EMRT-3 TaxID=3040349 RepID=UPI0024AEC12E|nr:tetratricopeptide repeat protein [Asticcacaulis sp. EMRT-3]MDI7774247.1 tetratricopeptide repeat protein [Asticcacaulis sp. EMRT-3]